MNKKYWITAIIIGSLLIVISYLGSSVFKLGINYCGHGEGWPIYLPSLTAMCKETIIPHPITKPALYTGIIILFLSIIGLIVNTVIELIIKAINDKN